MKKQWRSCWWLWRIMYQKKQEKTIANKYSFALFGFGTFGPKNKYVTTPANCHSNLCSDVCLWFCFLLFFFWPFFQQNWNSMKTTTKSHLRCILRISFQNFLTQSTFNLFPLCIEWCCWLQAKVWKKWKFLKKNWKKINKQDLNFFTANKRVLGL